MQFGLPHRSVRELPDPRDAGVQFAASWAVEREPGQTPSLVGLSHLLDLSQQANGGCNVHVWYGAKEGNDIAPLLAFLPRAEQIEIERLQEPSHRWSVAAARAAVRAQLADLLECAPTEVSIVRGVQGKPALDAATHGELAGQLHFNVSHTTGLVAVAIATRRIGIDVEAVKPRDDLDEIAAATFSEPMVDAIRNARTSSEKIALFYRFWTLGEALIKAMGHSSADDLRRFAFSMPDDPPRLTYLDENLGRTENWAFATIDATAPTD